MVKDTSGRESANRLTALIIIKFSDLSDFKNFSLAGTFENKLETATEVPESLLTGLNSVISQKSTDNSKAIS